MPENALACKLPFFNNTRKLLHRHHQMVVKYQTDYISYEAKDGEVLYRKQKRRPEAACGSDHLELPYNNIQT